MIAFYEAIEKDSPLQVEASDDLEDVKWEIREIEWLKGVAGNYLTPKARDVYDQRLSVLSQKSGEVEVCLTRN